MTIEDAPAFEKKIGNRDGYVVLNFRPFDTPYNFLAIQPYNYSLALYPLPKYKVAAIMFS